MYRSANLPVITRALTDVIYMSVNLTNPYSVQKMDCTVFNPKNCTVTKNNNLSFIPHMFRALLGHHHGRIIQRNTRRVNTDKDVRM